MSFSINNGPENIPAIQKSHHTNDGGAGNLGYFQQEKKQKDEEQKQENDVFELSTKKEHNEEDDDLLMVELDSIGSRIKSFWKSLHENFSKENPESP